MKDIVEASLPEAQRRIATVFDTGAMRGLPDTHVLRSVPHTAQASTFTNNSSAPQRGIGTCSTRTSPGA